MLDAHHTELLPQHTIETLKQELRRLPVERPKDGLAVIPPDRAKTFLRKHADLALAIYDLNNEGMVIL